MQYLFWLIEFMSVNHMVSTMMFVYSYAFHIIYPYISAILPEIQLEKDS